MFFSYRHPPSQELKVNAAYNARFLAVYFSMYFVSLMISSKLQVVLYFNLMQTIKFHDISLLVLR